MYYFEYMYMVLLPPKKKKKQKQQERKVFSCRWGNWLLVKKGMCDVTCGDPIMRRTKQAMKTGRRRKLITATIL